MTFKFGGSKNYHYKGSLGSALVSFSSQGLNGVHFVKDLTKPDPGFSIFTPIDEVNIEDLYKLPLLPEDHKVYQALEGKEVDPIKLDLVGTEFQKKVWTVLLFSRAGMVLSYRNIANNLGKPKSFRAVANACGANKIAVLVPCHRVIRSDGKLGGYKWGTDLKKHLLDREFNQLKERQHE